MNTKFRLYFVFSLCAILLVAFSISASAKQFESGSYIITATLSDAENFINKSVTFTPNNGTMQSVSDMKSVAPSDNNGYTFSGSWTVKMVDNSFIIEEGEETTVKLENAYFSILKTTPTMTYYREPTFNILITYSNGQYEYVRDYHYHNTNGVAYIEFTFTPKENVKSIKYHYTLNVPWEGETTANFNYYLGEFLGDQSYYLTFDQTSKEAGLLANIKSALNSVIEWVKGIKESIDGLWTKIENGIKGLFIPTEQNMIDFKSNMETLLHERLGAVAEVVDITLESWDRINGSDYTDTIEFPKSEINLPNDQKFAFGGYTVKIVPDGFEPIAVICKLICAISVTLLFVNGLRSRYENVVGS